MHATSLENMQNCYERFICSDYFYTKDNFSVLDIGGNNVNGSYRDVFSGPKFEYCAVDIEAGAGVDLVLADPYQLPNPSVSVDIVLAGQVFEHCEKFWLLFAEMARIVTEDGWIILIAPSAGSIHRFPVDCYRFYPDAYIALAGGADLHLIHMSHDNRGEWRDLVGVFSKTPDLPERRNVKWRPLDASQQNLITGYTSQVKSPPAYDLSLEAEVSKGCADKYDVLESIHTWLRPSLYLEIGVQHGKSLSLARCTAIAIDPDIQCNEKDFPAAQIFSATSDYYFDNCWPSHPDHSDIDLALIDGMHLAEFVLRDFINVERNSNSDTVVLIDDVYPNHPLQAQRARETRVWTGDVWKVYVLLREIRPDLDLTVLDVRPTGLLMVRGLNRDSRLLSDHYGLMLRRLETLQLENYCDLIFDRREAIAIEPAGYPKFLDSLPSASESRRGPAEFPTSDGSYKKLLAFSEEMADLCDRDSDAYKILVSVVEEKDELALENKRLIKQRQQLQTDLANTSKEKARAQKALDAVYESKTWRWSRWLRFW